MLATQDSLSAGDEHDRLRVVNNHRRAGHHVADLQLVEQEDGCVVHAADTVEIDGVCRICSGTVDRLLLERVQLLVHGWTKRVERLPDALDLGNARYG